MLCIGGAWCHIYIKGIRIDPHWGSKVRYFLLLIAFSLIRIFPFTYHFLFFVLRHLACSKVDDFLLL